MIYFFADLTQQKTWGLTHFHGTYNAGYGDKEEHPEAVIEKIVEEKIKEYGCSVVLTAFNPIYIT